MLALSTRGWIVRQRIIWWKTNPLPRGINDRLTPSHSVLYHLVQSPQYYFDRDALRQPMEGGLGRDLGDVWPLATRPGWGGGSHPATFPVELARRPLAATCPERVCATCGLPWRRVTFTQRTYRREERYRPSFPHRYRLRRQRGPLVPCACNAPSRPGRVLDPFAGSGTVCAAAQELGRDWLGIELNSEYAALAVQRLNNAAGRAPSAKAA